MISKFCGHFEFFFRSYQSRIRFTLQILCRKRNEAEMIKIRNIAENMFIGMKALQISLFIMIVNNT